MYITLLLPTRIPEIPFDACMDGILRKLRQSFTRGKLGKSIFNTSNFDRFFFFLFSKVLSNKVTVMVIWCNSSFTGGVDLRFPFVHYFMDNPTSQ
jgi:hypothetical protein